MSSSHRATCASAALLLASCGSAIPAPEPTAPIAVDDAEVVPAPPGRWSFELALEGGIDVAVGVAPDGAARFAGWPSVGALVERRGRGALAVRCRGFPLHPPTRVVLRDDAIATGILADGRLVLGPPGSADEPCDAGPGPSVDPAARHSFGLALDATGAPHACFRAPDGSLRYTGGGVEETVAPEGTDCDLALSSGGRPQVVLRSPDALVVAQRTDGGWSEERLEPGAQPRIAVGPDGTVAVLSYDASARAWLDVRGAGGWTREAVPFAAPAHAYADRAGACALVIGADAIHAVQLAEGLEYARRDAAARWTTERVDERAVLGARGQLVDLTLGPDGEPVLAYRRDFDTAFVARRIAPGRCRPEEVVQVDGVCCFEGQRVEGGRCAGAPRCPEGFVAEAGTCTPIDPVLRARADACAHAPFELGSELAPGVATACRPLLGDARALEYATRRCAADDPAYCFVAAILTRGSAPQELSVFAALTAIDGTRRQSILRTQYVATSTDTPGPPSTAHLETACRAGIAPACVVLANDEPASVPRWAAACEAGVIAACGWVGYHADLASAELDAALRATRAACERGDRVACAHAAYAEARRTTPTAALTLLERGCGTAAELPRAPTDPDEPPPTDDPETLSDERLDLDFYDAAQAARAQPCSAWVRLADAARVPLPRGSAARAVLAAACESDQRTLAQPCTSLAIALERGLGGPRDRRRAQRARELAEAALENE